MNRYSVLTSVIFFIFTHSSLILHSSDIKNEKAETTLIDNDYSEHARKFIEFFRKNESQNVNQLIDGIYQIFNDTSIENMLITPKEVPLNELKFIAAIASESDIREAVFNTCNNLETYFNNTFIAEPLWQFLIINFFMENPIVVHGMTTHFGGLISESNFDELNWEKFYFMGKYTPIMLSSGDDAHYELPLKFLEMIKIQIMRAYHPARVFRELFKSLLKIENNNLLISNYFTDLINELPNIPLQNLYDIAELALIFIGHPTYHQPVANYLEAHAQAVGEKEYILANIAHMMFEQPESKDYGFDFFHRFVLYASNIEVGAKWDIINEMHIEDKALDYFNGIWQGCTTQKEQIALIFHIMTRPIKNEQIRAFLASEIAKNFSDILQIIAGKPMEEQGRLYNDLGRFLLSGDEVLRESAINMYNDPTISPKFKFFILVNFIDKTMENPNFSELLNKYEINPTEIFLEQYLNSVSVEENLEVLRIFNKHTPEENNKIFIALIQKLFTDAKNFTIGTALQRRIIFELMHFIPNSQNLNLFLKLINFEEKLKMDIWHIYPHAQRENFDTVYYPHATSAILRFTYILKQLIADFDSYQFVGDAFNKDDVLARINQLFNNNELMSQALITLGEKREKYVTAAKINLKKFENDLVWNTPDLELKSIKISGETITIGQIISLFIYYIERQVDRNSYLSLVAAFVQAFANGKAVNACDDGFVSGAGNTIFAEEFKGKEKEEVKIVRSYLGFEDNISRKARSLKSLLIHFLSDLTGEDVFNINHPAWNKNIPSTENNMYLKAVLNEINRVDIVSIFGDKIRDIHSVFIKMNDWNSVFSPEEERLIRAVNVFIFRPAMLAFLAHEFSDFVVFESNIEDRSKLSFHDFMSVIDDVPYNDKIIE